MTVGLLSIDALDHRGTSLEHEAHSLSDCMGRNMVLRKVVFCQTRICSVSLGALPFGLVDIEEVPRAVCLTIHIRPVLFHSEDKRLYGPHAKANFQMESIPYPTSRTRLVLSTLTM